LIEKTVQFSLDIKDLKNKKKDKEIYMRMQQTKTIISIHCTNLIIPPRKKKEPMFKLAYHFSNIDSNKQQKREKHRLWQENGMYKRLPKKEKKKMHLRSKVKHF
jgi:hypothetical protein